MNKITIWWEGRDYTINTGGGIPYDEDYMDFVGFCQQLGKEGRQDILDVLTCNYRDEVEKSMRIQYNSLKGK